MALRQEAYAMTDALPEGESVWYSIKMIQKIITDKGEVEYDHSGINKKN